MTGPRVEKDWTQSPTADALGTPSIPRILSPDEFQQAKLLTHSDLGKAQWPVVPPTFAPKDVTQTRQTSDRVKGTSMSQDPTGKDLPWTPGNTPTKLAGILTRQVVAPVTEHPAMTAAIAGASALPVVGPFVVAALAGSMMHDVAQYAGQKAAEMSLSPEDRARAEADPDRIEGERAAVEAIMVGLLTPKLRADIKAGVNVGDVSGGTVEAGAAGLSEMQGPKVTDPLRTPIGAKMLGSLAGKAQMDESASPYQPDTPLHAAWKDGHATSQQGIALATAGGERFSGLPVTAELRARVEQHMSDVTDAWNTMFAPANRSGEAKAAANILRSTTGAQAAKYEQAVYKLNDFRKAIDPLPDADKLGFIDAIENGRSQANPEFQGPADAIRSILDEARTAVQDLGTGKLDDFIENYFPHIWDDPEKAGIVFGGKRPMEGGKTFLKPRTIPTTAEGIAHGLTPVSTNPVDLTLLKIREMQRYVMAHQSLTEMKDAGLVEFVGAGSPRPDGYSRINDNIATVFGPREGVVRLPEGAQVGGQPITSKLDTGMRPMQQEDVGVIGRRVMGEYWAPEPVARVVNNYLSPGMRGNALYDAYRGLGNMLNQAQLGLSGFHLMFTSMDASVSRMALGLEHLASGFNERDIAQVGRGFKDIASVPAAPITNVLKGAKIRSAYLDPSRATPEMQALANAVQEAGGRVRMDSFYKNSAPEKMIAAWREGGLLGTSKAVGYSIPALIETINKPLMEHIVPMQKLGVFGDLAEKALADLPPDASLAVRRDALSKAWDSVDNRMGQMVYDNLFWNKAFKDLAMASTRSLGWNLGTIRELGGGAGDIVGEGAKALTGQPAEFTHRAAYVMALPITVGMYGAVFQMLRTGEAPSELKDYYYPKTGDVDADGNPERVQIASYMKDVAAYANHPWETVKHKVNPLASQVVEMLNNQDYYGDEIRNPDDPAVKQALQEATYIAKQFEPFSIRNMQEASKGGDGLGTMIGQEFGITSAPREVVRSEAQNQMAHYLAQRGGGGNATPEDAEARKARAEILSGLRGNSGVDLEAAVTKAVERQQLTPANIVHLLKLAGSTPAQEKFKRLTLPQAMDVFQRSTQHEKEMFVDALATKIERSQKSDPPTFTAP